MLKGVSSQVCVMHRPLFAGEVGVNANPEETPRQPSLSIPFLSPSVASSVPARSSELNASVRSLTAITKKLLQAELSQGTFKAGEEGAQVQWPFLVRSCLL